MRLLKHYNIKELLRPMPMPISVRANVRVATRIDRSRTNPINILSDSTYKTIRQKYGIW